MQLIAEPTEEGREKMTDRAPLPYDFLPEVPAFTVSSTDVAAGEQMSNTHVYNSFGMSGDNISPELSWSGFPAETKSFAVTLYDPDAPTGSGFWHWLVLDIPVSVTELPTGAGAEGGAGLPAGAFMVRNDYGSKDFGGTAPPQGDPPHRYVFAVHALDVEKLGVDSDVSAAVAGFNLRFHTIARGLLIPVYGH
jgi:Raf kinase inhibitor-like YbhB/YbcL family protein